MMDIEIIKKTKRQCENEIKTIINMFEQQTGCGAEHIDIIRSQERGALYGRVVKVLLDVRVG